MKESYEKPKVEEVDLEESFSFGRPVSPCIIIEFRSINGTSYKFNESAL